MITNGARVQVISTYDDYLENTFSWALGMQGVVSLVDDPDLRYKVTFDRPYTYMGIVFEFLCFSAAELQVLGEG